MIKHSELKKFRARKNLCKIVDRALTSPRILDQEVFEEPKIITSRYFNFNHLALNRGLIRDLRLMPLKEEVLHGTYNALSRQDLLDRIKDRMGSEKMILLLNEYPYQLPKEALQCILWISDGIERAEIVKFLARLMYLLKLDEHDVIFFERSATSRSKFVRRSFPLMRHVHVWIRRKRDQNYDYLA